MVAAILPARGNCQGEGRGVYKGRPASIDVARIRKMKEDGFGASEIAKALKIGRASVTGCLARLPRLEADVTAVVEVAGPHA